jgi:hypothetical protein
LLMALRNWAGGQHQRAPMAAYRGDSRFLIAGIDVIGKAP